MADSRFNTNDPRFARQSKNKRKVVIDDRFKSMFEDGAFGKKSGGVDKYGRKKAKGASRKSDLQRFYRLDDDEEKEGGAKGGAKGKARSSEKGGRAAPSASASALSRLDELNKMARGEGGSDSSSDSDSDSDSESESDAAAQDPADICPPQFVSRAVAADEAVPTNGRRIAVVNLDWDRVKATDLFVLFQSFVPNVGALLSVSIYPSNFGVKRMAEEERFGPRAVWGKDHPSDVAKPKPLATGANADEELEEEDSDNDSDSDASSGEEDAKRLESAFDMEKLRKYELLKLKYYFAVVECDSARTSAALYQNCDGMEFEHSANTLSLSYIDDEMKFPSATVDMMRETCTEAPARYDGTNFNTGAKSHTHVELTWDGEDPERQAQLQWKPAAQLINDDDFAAYLASDNSSSSSDEEEEESEEEGGKAAGKKRIAKRSEFAGLLAAIGRKVEDVDEDKDGDSDSSDSDDDSSDEDEEVGAAAAAAAAGGGMVGDDDDEEEFGENDDWARELRASGGADAPDADDEEGEGKSLTFVPGLKDKIEMAAGRREAMANETVFEAYHRKKKLATNVGKAQKRRLKRQAQKAARKELEETMRKAKRRKTGGAESATMAAERAELELLLGKSSVDGGANGGDSDDDLSGKKKKKKKRAKGKKKRRDEQKEEDAASAKRLLGDDRFGAVLHNPDFAIDSTNQRFKATPVRTCAASYLRTYVLTIHALTHSLSTFFTPLAGHGQAARGAEAHREEERLTQEAVNERF